MPEALRRFENLRDRFPQTSAAHLGVTISLFALGRLDEADQTSERATALFSDDPEVWRHHARIAARRGDAAEALRRWAEADKNFPGNGAIQRGFTEARLNLVGEAVAADFGGDGLALEPAALTEVGQIIRDFESLGGTGQGCEFGFVQRMLGFESLSLLRWVGIEIEPLIEAINGGFEGVGTPEQTLLDFYDDGSDNPEYRISDRRFSMAMHTFIHKEEMSWDKMFVQTCRRLQFLKRKFIDDLAEANKIFVYKISERNLTDKEIEALHTALQRYGNNTLLYVSYSNSSNPTGSVQRARPGLMIGYIHQFSLSPSGEPRTPALPAWSSVCAEAHRLWIADRRTESERTVMKLDASVERRAGVH
jgi:hypothetical protein